MNHIETSRRPLSIVGTPTVFDTDIGCDIDDTWALLYFLNMESLIPALITCTRGNSDYRLRIIAKMLGASGNESIELGHGAPRVKGDRELMPQKPWVKGYTLSSYPGKIYRDGVGALIDKILGSADKVPVITIGPLTNIARAIAREPRIIDRMELYSMAGSVYEGLKDGSPPYPETNIRKDIKAARYVLESGARMLLSPIESAKRIVIKGDGYRRLLESKKPEVKALMETYRIWTTHPIIIRRNPPDPLQASTGLYDVQAVYLASVNGASNQFCEVDELRIVIDREGYTRLDPHGYRVKCATRWRDLEGFLDHFVEVLLEGRSGGV